MKLFNFLFNSYRSGVSLETGLSLTCVIFGDLPESLDSGQLMIVGFH